MPTLTPLFVLALSAFLLAGCTMPRDTSDTEGDVEIDSVRVDSGPMSPSGPPNGPPSGGPNIAAMPYGQWTYTAEAIDGDGTLSGTLVLADGDVGSRFTARASGDVREGELAVESIEMTNASLILRATVQTAEPFVIDFVGTVMGDQMTGELVLGGQRAYALSAERTGR